jgi:hypothetical protein
MIEATPSGWFNSALLSLSPTTRIVAFHTLPTHPVAKQARRGEGFLDLLYTSSSHISTIIPTNNYEIAPGGFPRCTAECSSYLDTACRSEDRWFVVGDAAMAFDLLSSQGMMTALEMGYYIGMVLVGLVKVMSILRLKRCFGGSGRSMRGTEHTTTDWSRGFMMNAFGILSGVNCTFFRICTFAGFIILL